MASFTLFFSICTLGVYLLITFKEEFVTEMVTSQLQEITGFTWRVHYAQLTFSPLPRISFQGILAYKPLNHDLRRLQSFSPIISAKSLNIEPDLLALASFKLVIKNLFLNSPHISLPIAATPKSDLMLPSSTDPERKKSFLQKVELNFHVQKNITQQIQSALNTVKKYINPNIRNHVTRLYITDGTILIRGKGNVTELAISKLNMSINSSEQKKSFFTGSLLFPKNNFFASMDGYFIFPNDNKQLFLTGGVEISTSLTFPDLSILTANISSSFFWKKQNNIIKLPDLTVSSAGDTFTADLLIIPDRPLLYAKIDTAQLSLPKWFYFARNLPPGLQAYLHKLSGSMDMEITPNSIYANNLCILTDKHTIFGSFDIENFADPVVNVDLDLEDIDLDYIFPFIATLEKKVPEPVRPKFSFPYLIPFSEDRHKDISDVDYNVTVNVKGVTAHSLQGDSVSINVFPMKSDVTRIRFFGKNLARGNLGGLIDITKKSATMQYTLKNIELAMLPENKNSSVVFSGLATGVISLDTTIKKGHWADDWNIKIDGDIDRQKISKASPKGWYFSSKKMNILGNGLLHTVREKGLSAEGNWKISSKDVFSSWYPNGKDSFEVVLNGSLAWPPIVKKKSSKKSGIQKIFGSLTATGSLIAPIGSQRVPIAGKATSSIDWNFDTDIINLPNLTFQGFGSFARGNLVIDTNTTLVSGDYTVKVNPKTLLTAWELLPRSINLPDIIIGNGNFHATPEQTVFNNLKMQLDGAPVRGTIKISDLPDNKQQTLLTLALEAERIDFDRYVEPETKKERAKGKTRTPWNLNFIKNIDIESNITFNTARFRNATFRDTKIHAQLSNNKFSLLSTTASIYGGKHTTQLQGSISPEKSILTFDKVYLIFKGISLGPAFFEIYNDSNYTGTADFVADVTGEVQSSADFPSAFSGLWGVEARDGSFPAFLGNDSTGLRNTFSIAKASGKMKKGILSSNNFYLTGAMVDMKGNGWFDMGKKELDIKAEVKLASIPTVPVHYTGSYDNLQMSVNGIGILTGTVQSASLSVFNILKGLLELPAKAIRSIDSATSSRKSQKIIIYPQK